MCPFSSVTIRIFSFFWFSHILYHSFFRVSQVQSSLLYCISSLIFNHCLKRISFRVCVRSITVEDLPFPLYTGDVPCFQFPPQSSDSLNSFFKPPYLDAVLHSTDSTAVYTASPTVFISQSPFYKTPFFMHYGCPLHITDFINRRGAEMALLI